MSNQGKPVAGAPLPSIGFDTLDHGHIDFSAVPGWRALIVYRGKHCPLCVRYLKGLDGMFGDFVKAGVAVFAVSADPEDRARSQQVEQGWRFPVGYGLSVEDMRRLGLYVSQPRSAEETDRPFAEPGVFVVNADDQLHIVDISNAPFARPDLAGLLGGIGFAKDKGYPIRGTL